MSGLYRKLHGETPDPSANTRATVAVPREVTGMGPLLVLEVERGGRVEQWHFAKPYPVLAFGRVTPTARGRSALFILGGGYSLASGQFRARHGRAMRALHVERTMASLPTITDRYRTTHGGRNPTQAFRAKVEVPATLVPVGRLYAVTYDADKGDGVYPYRHPFEPGAQPLVCANEQGDRLFLVGGRYTVTSHGIEDSE